MYQVLPLFKTHYSLGRSILTLEKPSPKASYKNSVFDLLADNKLDTLVLVEDNISGLLQASKQASESKVKLIFGLRMLVTDDLSQKDDLSHNKTAKYIIFAKSTKGYDALLKLYSIAAKDGFYYQPRLDFKTIKRYWNENLTLAVPFYDSFLYLNAFHSHCHVPEIESFKPVFFIEDNDLPFDALLAENVKKYCEGRYHTLPAQSIYYNQPEDFVAYLTFRCIHGRGNHGKTSIEKPELEHMGSNQFNFQKWLSLNNNYGRTST
jgi:DNA polymerase III alpha subunit